MIDVGLALFDELDNQIEMAPQCSIVQWRHRVVIGSIYARSVFNEPDNNLCMAIFCSDPEGSLSLIVGLIDARLTLFD